VGGPGRAGGGLGGWAAGAGPFAAMRAVGGRVQGAAGWGDPQWGKLHLLDGLEPSLRTMRIAKDPECRSCNPA